MALKGPLLAKFSPESENRVSLELHAISLNGLSFLKMNRVKTPPFKHD